MVQQGNHSGVNTEQSSNRAPILKGVLETLAMATPCKVHDNLLRPTTPVLMGVTEALELAPKHGRQTSSLVPRTTVFMSVSETLQ